MNDRSCEVSALAAACDKAYRLQGGVYTPTSGVLHREEEYSSEGFSTLLAMQHRHFWYRGRHRFLWRAVQSHTVSCGRELGRVIDCGGGCGGWVDYLVRRTGQRVSEMALADSSLEALAFAKSVLPSYVKRYQIDLLDLKWQDRWNTVFLLDVLEHIPDHERALVEIRAALSLGGLLFITTPAFPFLWTWNDEAVHHQRRYTKGDFERLASACGYKLLKTRYFMFLLAPLLMASRWMTAAKARATDAGRRTKLVESMHRVPTPIINTALSGIFALETPLGNVLPFPFGTSVLAVMQKTA